MGYKEVNNCGLNCPQPVINTKKALDEMTSGTVVSIVDNEVAKENVLRFAQNAGYEVTVEEAEGNYLITITKGEKAAPQVEKAVINKAVTDNNGRESTVYLVITDSIGQGSPDLGYTLIRSFFKTLRELNPAPAALIFMNAGVKLVVEGAQTLEDIVALHNKGTEILACGTCLDYYKIKEKLAVGVVSNMFEIVEKMGTGKVITIS